MTKRDLNIEILRCLLMLGVCLVHTLAVGVVTKRFSSLAWIRGLLVCSVDGFVFISGYYGIRFSLKKIFSLYAVALFYSMISGTPLACIYGFWFLHAYAALTLIAPILNFSGWTRCLPFLLFVFVYGWLANFNHINALHLPLVIFREGHTWTTLVGVYVAARLYREYEIDKRLSLKCCLLAIPFFVALYVVHGGFGAYNSPSCVGLAVVIFTIFKKIDLSPERFPRLSACVTWIVPSLFPIYIIHQTPLGFRLIRRIGECRGKIPLPDVMVGLCFGVGVFVVCLAIDSMRRLVVKGGIKVWRRCMAKSID